MKKIKISFYTLLLIIIISCTKQVNDGHNYTSFNQLKNTEGYYKLFEKDSINEITLHMKSNNVQEYHDKIENYRKIDENIRLGDYLKVDFEYEGAAGKVKLKKAAFRIKGNTTRENPFGKNGELYKTGFKIRFDHTFDYEKGTKKYKEQKKKDFYGMKEINFGAYGALREFYSLNLLNKVGVTTAKSTPAKVYISIDGKKYFYGLYLMTEVIDKNFIKKRYGKNQEDGNLYKCLSQQYGKATLTQESIKNPKAIGMKDRSINYRPTYDLKTNKSKKNFSDLKDFIYNLNNLQGKELKKYLDKNFEVDRFLKFLALNYLIGNKDDYRGNGNNYYLYFPTGKGKIEYIPYDFNKSLGYYKDTRNADLIKWVKREVKYKKQNERPLTDKILAIDSYREKYISYIKKFIKPSNHIFVYQDFENLINYYKPVYAKYYLESDAKSEFSKTKTIKIEKKRLFIIKDHFYQTTEHVVKELKLNKKDYNIKTGNVSYIIRKSTFELKESVKSIINNIKTSILLKGKKILK